MKKIPTIFERDWDGNRGVIPKFNEEFKSVFNAIKKGYLVPAEKLDGTNVRVTVRNRKVVRLEKRRNPTPGEKKDGVIDPLYVDASVNNPEDTHIIKAVCCAYFAEIDDGEYSGEAIGENIQGNPLN